MFDMFLRNAAPVEIAGPLFLAGMAWFGLHQAVIAPEIGARLATKQHIPACIADVDALQTERLAEVETSRARLRAERERIISEAQQRVAKRRAEIARLHQGLDLIRQSPLGALMESLDPGSQMTGDLTAFMPDLPELDLDALDLPDLPAPLPLPDHGTQAEYCGCIVGAALDETRFDHALWTASLTLYQPRAVTGFQSVVARSVQGGACGGLPKG